MVAVGVAAVAQGEGGFGEFAHARAARDQQGAGGGDIGGEESEFGRPGAGGGLALVQRDGAAAGGEFTPARFAVQARQAADGI